MLGGHCQLQEEGLERGRRKFSVVSESLGRLFSEVRRRVSLPLGQKIASCLIRLYGGQQGGDPGSKAFLPPPPVS